MKLRRIQQIYKKLYIIGSNPIFSAKIGRIAKWVRQQH